MVWFRGLQAVTNFPTPPCPMPYADSKLRGSITTGNVNQEQMAAATGDLLDTYEEVNSKIFP
jgi:hypothetical protein